MLAQCIDVGGSRPRGYGGIRTRDAGLAEQVANQDEEENRKKPGPNAGTRAREHDIDKAAFSGRE